MPLSEKDTSVCVYYVTGEDIYGTLLWDVYTDIYTCSATDTYTVKSVISGAP